MLNQILSSVFNSLNNPFNIPSQSKRAIKFTKNEEGKGSGIGEREGQSHAE